ncbi:hypothetical protein AB0B50_27330 [Streptomyces sp. NPDC041068]|uniref:hypothetical protein n=1 Tax=Streptomyces sp. NPDC041068 TaxID=3155130 RepID=UPI0033F6DA61
MNGGRMQEQAEQQYREAAEGSDLDAMIQLGWLLQLREERSEAERWSRQAADAGYAHAMGLGEAVETEVRGQCLS